MASQALVLLWDEKTTWHQKRMERIGELGRLIPEMPESKLVQKIESLSISLQIFTGNFGQLGQALYFLTEDERGTDLMFEENRNRLDSFLKELARLLHNYVAAAQSLVDHTRRLYHKLYEPEHLFSDYQERVDTDFTNNPLARFVQELRNYILHYDVPTPVFHMHYDATSAQGGPLMTRSASLPVARLREFDGWRSKAKEFMQDKESIDVFEVIQNYTAKVLAFHTWFQRRQQEIHAPEFERLNARKREMFHLWLDMALEAADAGDFGFFHSLLTHDEWQDVIGTIMTPTAVPCRIIVLLGKKGRLTGRLKRRIMALCQTPGFTLPTQYAWAWVSPPPVILL